MSRTAIVYYSKSGHSRRIAERLGHAFHSDVFALKTVRYGMPLLGYLRAGYDSLSCTLPPLNHPLPTIKDYDALVICGPVWTSFPAAPLNSYFKQVADLPPTVGLMLTQGDQSTPEKAFEIAEHELGRIFDAKSAIANSIEGTPEAQTIIDQFVHKMTRAGAGTPKLVRDASGIDIHQS